MCVCGGCDVWQHEEASTLTGITGGEAASGRSACTTASRATRAGVAAATESTARNRRRACQKHRGHGARVNYRVHGRESRKRWQAVASGGKRWQAVASGLSRGRGLTVGRTDQALAPDKAAELHARVQGGELPQHQRELECGWVRTPRQTRQVETARAGRGEEGLAGCVVRVTARGANDGCWRSDDGRVLAVWRAHSRKICVGNAPGFGVRYLRMGEVVGNEVGALQ
jgi:hypothetical protein